MTKIFIEYDTDTGRGHLEATIGERRGAWSLSGDTVANLDAVLTAHYGPLDGTGCGWSSPEDDDYTYTIQGPLWNH